MDEASMEDLEQRRERLRALRAQAAQSEAARESESFALPGGLSNPLLDGPETFSGHGGSRGTARFDFYTDPMAAFSGNKKRGTGGDRVGHGHIMSPSGGGSSMPRFSSPHPGPRNLDTTPPSACQMQSDYSANQLQNIYSPTQRMYQGQSPHPSTPAYRSPRCMTSPFFNHQGTSPDVWSGSGVTAGYDSSIPRSDSTRSYPMYQGHPNVPPMASPSFDYRHGRGRMLGNSPHFNSGPGTSYSPRLGRGQGQWDGSNKSPALGQSRGRGRGSYFRGPAPNESLGPESFYHSSMVEDPWRHLEAVVWKGINFSENKPSTPGSSSSWLPKSISTKKPRVSQPSFKSNTGQSLAEFLAASLNEAANHESTHNETLSP